MALTNRLCQPPAMTDVNLDGFVHWREFSQAVREDTNAIFLEARKGAPENTEIKKQESQITQGFSFGLRPLIGN